MLAAQQVLDDADGTDITFELVSQDKTGTSRLDSSTTLAQPRMLNIRHSVSGKGVDAIDRHLVQVTQKIVSGSSEATATVNFTVAMPRNPIITEAMIYDLCSVLICLVTGEAYPTVSLTTTTIQKLLRGEA